MPQKATVPLPSPVQSSNRTATTSRKSERSSSGIHDTDYRRNALRLRGIYINESEPPLELLQRARRTTERQRASPEMDDSQVRRVQQAARGMEDAPEDNITQILAPRLFPAIRELNDPRLAISLNQLWINQVPVPQPQMSTMPFIAPPQLPLPRSKPDHAFGYSHKAFTPAQKTTIDLVSADPFGQSYAVPVNELHFPFLSIEYKSQAKGGTHYAATNQAAGAGAVAMYGHQEFMSRAAHQASYDYDQPHFFSVTMDNRFACINVHWMQQPTDTQCVSFHMWTLSSHVLFDADGVRAISRAVKNILDYGADERLRGLCQALDAHAERLARERAQTTSQSANEHIGPPSRSRAPPQQRSEAGPSGSGSSHRAHKRPPVHQDDREDDRDPPAASSSAPRAPQRRFPDGFRKHRKSARKQAPSPRYNSEDDDDDDDVPQRRSKRLLQRGAAVKKG